MLFTGLLTFSCFVELYFCYNIDTNYPIIYEDPQKGLSVNSNNPIFFGYSVVLYPGNKSKAPWILIGAPRGYNINEKNKTGICFKCKIAEVCEAFDVHGLSKYSNSKDDEKIDTAWIGGSMDINYISGRIVTCAPRWIHIKRKDSKIGDYQMQGACYWFHSNDNSTQKLLPLLDPSREVYTHPGGGGSVYNFAQGQSGFSVHLPTKNRELLLGAPGVYNWDGTSILYKDNHASDPVASRLRNINRRLRYADSSELSYKNIGDAIETKETLAYDLLGYSVTSGYFYNKLKLFYVTSAPRSNYQGQVLIYNFDAVTEKPLKIKEFKLGKQFGEYFGGSLTAGDINGDGLDDLIVGAPYHTTKKYNEGKIYIFLGSKSEHLQTPKRDSVEGKSTNGQFGATLQYLGDIDHDGFGDLGVAAPYEEKSGVVYIFRGTYDGLDINYSQRIVGRDVYDGIRGFGISISRTVDMDINGYPDFAVGAYLSGHVVLLRSRPVITIFQELKSFVQHLDFKARKFEMSYCFWYKLDQLDSFPISINRSLLFDQQLDRAYIEPANYVKIVNLRPNQRVCENFTVNLGNSFLNRYDPITVSLSHTFITNKNDKQVVYVYLEKKGEDMFCPRCPVYNKYGSISTSTLEIPFALGCKSGNICKASLELKPQIIDIEEDEGFVLGSKDYIILQINITNFGEKAYLTQVLVTLPEGVTFRSTPPACTEKTPISVLCAVDNPLESNSNKLVTLDLDMTTVNRGKLDEFLVLKVEVMTSSKNDKDKVKQLELKLKREADVTITGQSDKQSYSLKNITQDKPNFTQEYKVEKFGSSSLNEILVEINIPHIFKISDDKKISFIKLYPPVLFDQEVYCTSNFTYLSEEKRTSAEAIYSEFVDDENVITKKPLKRSLIETDEFNKSANARIVRENEFDAFQNRTFYINCSMEQIICAKVFCMAGPLKSNQILKIKLKMLFDIAAITDILGKKDAVLFATEGRVIVVNPSAFIQSGDKPDNAKVVSFFIRELQAEPIPLWIIILSAVAGLILFLLLVFGLIKLGFFKRTTKEELQQLKKEMENDACQKMNEEEQDQNIT